MHNGASSIVGGIFFSLSVENVSVLITSKMYVPEEISTILAFSRLFVCKFSTEQRLPLLINSTHEQLNSLSTRRKMARKISLQNICIIFCLIPCSFYVSHTFNISIIASSNLIIRCLPDQSSILLQLKQEFSPEGPAKSSPKMRTWKEGSDCCFWDGVICDETSSGLVVGLNLSKSSLQGPLRSNSSLFRLVRLQKLDLAFNDFSLSRIPSRLGQLSSLTYLNLCSSNISGAVPPSIWNLSQLTLLDLSFNDLYGRIPSTLGNLR